MSGITAIHSDCSPDLKVESLSRPETYLGTSKVDVLETYMSWIFLTDGFVYKLKKPISYDFLDFSTLKARYICCMEEALINQPLGGNTYLGVIPLKLQNGMLQLDGNGETIDWLVKMRRLPQNEMLDLGLKKGVAKNDRIKQAAEKLADFYLASVPVESDGNDYRQKIIKDIEDKGDELLKKKFKLQHSQIITITTDLLHFVMHRPELFDERIAQGKIKECHGDLRPEHICLAPNPVFIDRIEYNSDLRIMDVAEELSLLMLECEILQSPSAGQLFMKCYQLKSKDNIPEVLVSFYKAKRAFQRAWLTTHQLLVNQNQEESWRGECDIYLRQAQDYCSKLNEG